MSAQKETWHEGNGYHHPGGAHPDAGTQRVGRESEEIGWECRACAASVLRGRRSRSSAALRQDAATCLSDPLSSASGQYGLVISAAPTGLGIIHRPVSSAKALGYSRLPGPGPRTHFVG